MTAPAPFRRTIRAAAFAGLLCSAAPAALAQAMATAPTVGSGISQEQALALTARLDALERQNAELAAQIQDLKAQASAQTQAVRDEVHNAPTVSVAGGRPTITSADGKFSVSLRGVIQFDAAAYDQASPGPITTDLRRSGGALGASASNVDLTHARELKNGDLFRRARIGIDGTAFGDWDYRILLDFGGSGVENTGQLYEGWLQYNGLKPVRIRVGAFSPSLGMDDQGSTNGMPFLERSTATDLARNLAGGDTRTGAQLFGYGDHWLAAGAVTGRIVGVLNTGTATPVLQTYGDQLGLTGRLAGTPFYGQDWLIHLGGNGSYVVRPANTTGPSTTGATLVTGQTVSFSDTPEIRVDGTRLINTGNIPARHASTLGAEFAAQRKNLLLQAEYQRLGVERSDGFANPHFDGFHVQGIWNITGETRRYNIQTAAFDAPPVARPFNWGHGGWGAWEAGLRYSDSDLNFDPGSPGTFQTGSSIRGGEEKNITAGVNWYWNSLARVMFDFQNVRIERLSPATSSTAASTIWFTPPGAQIGQTFNVWSVRTQFAF
ncbi:porin [Phenylobacterium sp.]|jgi:phosphate-selective porin OprO/OprP|uniref:porin n=1 Tax=Phenylobacterium sp. TaxID=1871053 RepID=UPI002E309F2F|nr:porin [Phenylobacterium sp.]HEX4710255.1 porin [Phenylobacterium sp.]